MPRAKTHKIAPGRRKGLSDGDAARLHYIVACAASPFTDDYENGEQCARQGLQATFPDDSWHVANARIDSTW
jgi:hypothetical protein